ncbi:DUF4097 family beta strand repeat-containing protein [Bhargavaea ullalensis]|uniref:DUF4097 and DUF4098 domain-containing protein YvlB n=1 Tax=Bhargavaea ullalensis TaxID=1265685 RepID=A0ABV2GCF8_9BACL
MDKKAFLEELQRELGRLPAEERTDILQDLDEYFEEGMREGKSEQDIAASLGKADEIARDILSAYPEYAAAEQEAVTGRQDARYELVRLGQKEYSRVVADLRVGELKLMPSDDAVTRFELIGDQSEVKFDADVTDDQLLISLKGNPTLTSWFRRSVSRPVRLVAHLPKKLYESMRLQTANGIISAENLLSKTLTAESRNGRIGMRACAFGTLSARTDNGRIEMSKIEADSFAAVTDNGRIELSDIRADHLAAETDNGRITLSDINGNVTAKTDNGRIELSADHLDRNIHLKTANGSIRVLTRIMPQDAVIRVRSTHAKPDIFGSSESEQSFGSGSHTVRLETDNGHISIQQG